MKEIILVKNGELALKGLNRSSFESALMRQIRRSLQPAGRFKIRCAQSTIYVEPEQGANLGAAAERMGKIFGIAGYSRAAVFEKDLENILQNAPDYLAEQLQNVKTFKVEAKRADKKFPYQSPQICAALGERLLERFPHLKVDVNHPDLVVMAEIRDFGAYVHGRQLPGAGGMPVGTGGKAAVLISGGIDSPVAAYMMAKRGMRLTGIHFASPPYTSQRAELKVRQLLEKVAEYAGPMRMIVVPFTEIQEQIEANCPDEFFTLIMRRYMMRISCRLSERWSCAALVTGESIGQVASQTLPALVCTDAVCDRPVFRPLIGMDKEEIVAIARKIGTFDLSILPYEDCCTVFTPRHPKLNPKLAALEHAEAKLDKTVLIERAVEQIRIIDIGKDEGNEL